MQGFYLPGVAPRAFKDGEAVQMKVQTLVSTETPLQVQRSIPAAPPPTARASRARLRCGVCWRGAGCPVPAPSTASPAPRVLSSAADIAHAGLPAASCVPRVVCASRCAGPRALLPSARLGLLCWSLVLVSCVGLLCWSCVPSSVTCPVDVIVGWERAV